MGMFSINESVASVTLEGVEAAELNMFSTYHEGAIMIIAESEQNFNNLMSGIGIHELMVYESTGQDVVYESDGIKGIFSRIKEFFMKLWSKIKALFEHFIAKFDAMVKGDKAFVDKYKKQLYANASNMKDFKYNGYEFFEGSKGGRTTSEARTDARNSLDSNCKIRDIEKAVSAGKWDDAIKLSDIHEKFDDYVENARGSALGESGGLTASEYTKELFKLFRNGESEKQSIELKSGDLDKMLGILTGAEKARTQLDKDFNELKKSIDNEIKVFEKSERDMLRDMPNEAKSKLLQGIQMQASVARETLNIATTFFGANMTANKDRSGQYKSVCAQLLHYKPKSESTWSHNESAGFLASVVMK